MNLSECERRTLELLLEIAAVSMRSHRIGITDAAAMHGIVGSEHQSFQMKSGKLNSKYTITIDFLTCRQSIGKPEQMTHITFIIDKTDDGKIECFSEARAHPGSATREVVRDRMHGRTRHVAKSIHSADDAVTDLVSRYMEMLDSVSAAMDAVWNDAVP